MVTMGSCHTLLGECDGFFAECERFVQVCLGSQMCGTALQDIDFHGTHLDTKLFLDKELKCLAGAA